MRHVTTGRPLPLRACAALLALAALSAAACSDAPAPAEPPDRPSAALVGGGYEPSPTPTVPTCTIVSCPSNVGGGPLIAGRYYDGFGYDIVLIPTQFGVATRVTSSPGWEYVMALSPDRKRIAFGTTRHGGSVYVVNVDGTGLTKLANVDSATVHNVSGVAWSPDGKRIVYSGKVNGQHDVFLVNPDGTGKTQVTNDAYADITPVFTPDGTNLIVSSTRGTPAPGNRELWRITLAGASVLRLTQTPQDERWPSFAPNGAMLYHRWDYDAGVQTVLLGNGWGQNPTPVLSHSSNDFFMYPSLSPDGTQFAYTLQDPVTKKTTVWRSPLANPAGGATRLTSTSVSHDWPRW
jgi:Tol biopolymer transport system component